MKKSGLRLLVYSLLISANLLGGCAALRQGASSEPDTMALPGGPTWEGEVLYDWARGIGQSVTKA